MSTGLDNLQLLRDGIARIHALDPEGKYRHLIPTNETIQSLHAVQALVFKLEHPPAPRPTEQDKKWIDLNKAQTETSARLADFVRRGLVTYEAFPFPPETLPVEERIAKLNGINVRLQQVWEEHHWTPEYRAKVALHRLEVFETEFEKFKSAVNLRFAEIEQELSRT